MNTHGNIFELHRFSLNDGPGIRTTVFLKGCPMECVWCHNPESQAFKPQLSFNPDKCIDCMECVKVCSAGAHHNIDGKHFLDWNLCNTHGNCVDVCSSGALKIIGYRIEAAKIIEEVLKDKAYYIKSGGGITISGGEPLAQFEFTKEILMAAKEHNIHTCIDTCGFAPQRKYEEILPYTDLFLFDYKATDDNEHKNLTGVSNKQVLENLEFLMSKGANIILRCPIIPGVNDSEEHLTAIRELLTKYPGLKSIEIMPYHSMGRDKAKRIGREYKQYNLPDTNEAAKKEWMGYFKGLDKVVCN